MSEEKENRVVENNSHDNSGLSPPRERNGPDEKLSKKMLPKSGKKKSKKLGKDFTASDLQELQDKLDKKEIGFLNNLTTKRYTKKVSRGIIVERLITLSLVLIILTIGVVYSVSYTYVNSGYGINVVADQQITKAISLSDEDDFSILSVGLKASAVTELDNISYNWLPTDLDDRGGGQHNQSGDNFIAYTFYVLNTGNADLEYSSVLRIRNSTLNVQTAVRVQVFTNGVPTIYTHTYENDYIDGVLYNIDSVLENDYGIPVEEFYSEEILVSNVMSLNMDSYDRYTIVIWLEGEDYDCVNDKFSSELQLAWNISVIDP